MRLSDLSVRRPVLAMVMSALLIVLGALAFFQLPLRELPDIDPPIVSIETAYRGASAAVVESRITQIIEDVVSGIEGIQTVQSTSENGRSSVTVEFSLERDIESATNDVRDAVNRVVAQLPVEADPPQIAKQDADAQPIIWLNLSSEGQDLLALTDYAQRYVVDRLSSLPGVARVNIGGQQRYAMRVWLKPEALAARGLAVSDVVNALRRENVELPAGRLESVDRDFTLRIERAYRTPEAFAQLPVARSAAGQVVTLGEVADVVLGAVERRSWIRGNGEQQIGLGVIKQSQANTLEVAQRLRAEAQRLSAQLPPGTRLFVAFDTSVYIESAIHEVYLTLALSVVLVIAVIYGFLGSWRAALIPAVTVPVCVVASFIALWAFGFSINLITLLALVLSIGLVVDDAIVVLENCQRHVALGAHRLVAAARGTRQVAFAVVSTTAVLVAVFLPIAFLQGNLGRLFRELAIAIAASVAISAWVALSLSPMMASRLLRPAQVPSRLARPLLRAQDALANAYRRWLNRWLARGWGASVVVLVALAASIGLYAFIPKELAPAEDQGSFFITVNAPEGAGFDYTAQQALLVERALMRWVDQGQASRVIVRVPRGQGGAASEEMHTAQALVFLAPWGQRPGYARIQADMQRALDGIAGVRSLVTMRQGLVRAGGTPVQLVLGGPDYASLAQWRDRMLERAAENPGLIGLDADYKETRPETVIEVDHARAAALGVSTEEIGSTLETLLGSRRVTTFEREGEEYDLWLQAQRADRSEPNDLLNLQVRAQDGKLVALGNLVRTRETASSGQLNRFNRMRAITLSARLAPGYSLGEALDYLERLAREELPPTAQVDYRGESRDYRQSGGALPLLFAFALLVVYLVLAAQFESFIHPLVIILTVPLAIFGALGALWLAAWVPSLWGAPGLPGGSVNLYSAIGMVILVGIATKNGILIVEFANQLRDAGRSIPAAIAEAACVRLRPILMTSLATVAGAVPLLLAQGAGANSRFTIGLVIVAGVFLATGLTLFVVPAFYALLARFTDSPGAIARTLEALEHQPSDAPTGPPA